MKIAVLLFLGLYFGLLLGFRSYLLYRKAGVNPIKKTETGKIAGFVNKLILFCIFLLLVIALNYLLLEKNYQLLVPIPYLEKEWLQWTGAVLGIGGLIFSFIAQIQMGDSWRTHHNESEKPALVTSGLFRFSRNPVYLGLGVAFTGFFFMLPNAFSMSFLLLTLTAVSVKIRLEEEYLERIHGTAFIDYCEKVHRWI